MCVAVMAVLAGSLAIAAVVGAVVLFLRRFVLPGRPPITFDDVRPARPFVDDRAERKRVLKQPFNEARASGEWDAIVVGSGVGGLGVAALLAKAGWRVLVLEQHSVAGGGSHTFEDRGYEFDIGIHYVGEMQKGHYLRAFSDIITDGQLQWALIDPKFDEVRLSNPEGEAQVYEIPTFAGKVSDAIKNYFPKDTEAVQKYFNAIQSAARKQSMVWLVILKRWPIWITKLIIKSGFIHMVSPWFKMAKISTKNYICELTDNKDLQMVLAYSFGDYGSVPSEGSFMMHGLLTMHFGQGGAFYPVGGASEMAFHTIRAIEAAGGTVLTRALVRRVLFDSAGRVCGVSVKQKRSSTETVIRTPIVISNAGVRNTFQKLAVHHPLASGCRQATLAGEVGRSMAAMQVFIGLNAPSCELGVRARNYWCFPSNDLDAASNYLELTRDEALDVDPPYIFVSFPSTKDPLWESRHPGKSVCTIVTCTNHEWFREWERAPQSKRAKTIDYESVKKTIGDRIVQFCLRYFPQLADKVDFVDYGTPPTHQYYIGCTEGEIYSLGHTTTRFEAENWGALRPETDIPGLYLTGQDLFVAGYAYGGAGAILCASKLLKRHLTLELSLLAEKDK